MWGTYIRAGKTLNTHTHKDKQYRLRTAAKLGSNDSCVITDGIALPGKCVTGGLHCVNSWAHAVLEAFRILKRSREAGIGLGGADLVCWKLEHRVHQSGGPLRGFAGKCIHFVSLCVPLDSPACLRLKVCARGGFLCSQQEV